jgi:hypothetical protein
MRGILVLIITICLLSGVIAQSTPSPAPTKTEVPAQQATEINTPDEVTRQSLTLTQADMQVITGNVQRPNGMVWHNGMLYIVCTGDWTVYEVDAETGSTRTYIYGVRNGHMLYAEEETNQPLTLWIPDFNTNQFLRVNATRSPQVVHSGIDAPWGMVRFDEERFLVTSLNNNSIHLIDRDGNESIVIDELRSPTGIAGDADFIYFANSGSARRSIEWFSRDEIDLTSETPVDMEARPLVGGLQNVTGLTIAGDHLYFAYSIGTRGVVGRVQPDECRDNGCTNDQVEIVLYTELAAPLAGLTISPDMKLFVHTMFRPEIYWVQLPTSD